MPASICQLCGQPDSTLLRCHGLDLCDACGAGHFEGRSLGDWDAGLRVREWHSGIVNKMEPLAEHHRLKGTVWATMPVPLHAAFFSEHLGHRVIKLFTDELHAGDPLFDDRIWVRTHDREGTARLLSNVGAQAAILELVTLGGAVEIRPEEIEFRLASRQPIAPGPPRVAAMCLLRHVCDLKPE